MDEAFNNRMEYANNRVVYNSPINRKNIGMLRPYWSIKTTLPVSSKPLLSEGKVFFTDWEGYGYCADNNTGKIIWKTKIYNPPTPAECGDIVALRPDLKGICPPYLWSGLVGTGTIHKRIWYVASVGGKPGLPFLNVAPGMIFAIDTEKGFILWKAPLTTYPLGGSISKLLYAEGMVYVGISSIDEAAYPTAMQLKINFKPGGVGEVIAFDAVDGRRIWSTKTVGMLPGEPPNAVGASMWDSFALDTHLQMIYFSTGNNFGPPASKSSDAIVALDSKTGKFKWQQQVIKGDIWLPGIESPDADFGAGPQLFEVYMHNSGSRKLVGIGGKDGWYYALDRVTGAFVWSNKVFTRESSGSGIRGAAAAKDGAVYVWSENGWDDDAADDPVKYPITVAKINAATGKTIWSKTGIAAGGISAGILLDGVYLVGDVLGKITAYDTYDGTEVWQRTLQGASICSDIASYGNMVYVGVGIPNIYGGIAEAPGVYTFKLRQY
jgi:polyvinyl alcohol dehydrogenase (cytochrome)